MGNLGKPLPTALNHALQKRFHCLAGILPSSLNSGEVQDALACERHSYLPQGAVLKLNSWVTNSRDLATTRAVEKSCKAKPESLTWFVTKIWDPVWGYAWFHFQNPCQILKLLILLTIYIRKKNPKWNKKPWQHFILPITGYHRQPWSLIGP